MTRYGQMMNAIIMVSMDDLVLSLWSLWMLGCEVLLSLWSLWMLRCEVWADDECYHYHYDHYGCSGVRYGQMMNAITITMVTMDAQVWGMGRWMLSAALPPDYYQGCWAACVHHTPLHQAPTLATSPSMATLVYTPQPRTHNLGNSGPGLAKV